ncbi:hypothetical protein Egran_01940 [Elaphomyces granulatus]|uniref:Gcp-like domain-containing protein n=1 Tax=Elaphomyces granulatus TaxID=519963 RepID=A0A232M1Q7_9EURO|nr:hypothetical protein Egran_01940 [Elaphomyces granulatus]
MLCLRTTARKTLRWSEDFGSTRISVSRRCLLTFAIETSCDDTSVSVIEKDDQNGTATIHFLENITADTRRYRGIHPIEALHSHQENLTKLVDKALKYLPVATGNWANRSRNLIIKHAGETTPRRLPDFISVARGPGMRPHLSVGLDTGKGLSVAWQIPFVGVHHMQAHLLTPRLVSALIKDEGRTEMRPERPSFPFTSILVSGGHSMLVISKSMTDHEIIASTVDIAIGEALDKSARLIIPQHLLETAENTMYGKMLEKFAFPNGAADYADYRPAVTRGEELIKRESPWGWSFTVPFANTRQLRFSFAAIHSTLTKLFSNRERTGEEISQDERIALAREAMRVCFEHLASRTIIALEALRSRNVGGEEQIRTIVVSGGVAANQFLITVLRSFLDVRGFEHIEIIAPPPFLCTDNAAMIGWAGIEMFEAGWRSELSCRALRKWTLDPRSDDGGILGPSDWSRK